MASTNYGHISANATTALAGYPCELATVTINALGATSNTVTLYDSNTGAAGALVIAVINTTTQIGTLIYNVQCRNGLVAVMAAGTPADVTVCYR